MGKLERVIEAIEALPEHRREEIADMVLELTEAFREAPGQSSLSDEQLAEVRRRRAEGYKPGDASRIDKLLARLV